jgi:hypothetical protein
MSSLELVAWCIAFAAVPAPVGSEDAFLAFDHEITRMPGNAGSGFGFGLRFSTPDFPSEASAWPCVEARADQSQSTSPGVARGDKGCEDRPGDSAVRKCSTARIW